MQEARYPDGHVERDFVKGENDEELREKLRSVGGNSEGSRSDLDSSASSGTQCTVPNKP